MASGLLRRDKAKAMAVGIAGEAAGPEAERRRLRLNGAWRDQRQPMVSGEAHERIKRFQHQGRLPVRDVVRAEIGRGGPAVARRQILEQFDAGPLACAKRRNSKPGTEYVIQMLLLDVVVLAFASDLRPNVSR